MEICNTIIIFTFKKVTTINEVVIKIIYYMSKSFDVTKSNQLKNFPIFMTRRERRGLKSIC